MRHERVAVDSSGDNDVAMKRALIAVVAFGALLRIALALVSIGSNDVPIWQAFGRDANREGFLSLWVTHGWMNHPPFPVAYATLVNAIVGESTYRTGLLIKLPGLVADVVSMTLVASIVTRRAGSRRAGVIAATLLAVNPTSLLIVGYHGNTDPILAMFVLVTWWLADRGRFGLAALALGASINVKLGPAPSLVLLLACARSQRELLRIVAGLAASAVPFVVMTVLVGPEFLRHTVGYRPPAFSWLANVAWFSRNLPTVGPLGMFLSSTHYATVTQSTFLIAAALAWVRRRTPDRYDVLTLGALYWAAFMFWNGGGLQYAIWPVPLLAAVRPRLALGYGVAAGVWLAWAYYDVLKPGFPLESVFELTSSEVWQRAMPLPLIALLACVVSLARRSGKPTIAPALEPERTAMEPMKPMQPMRPIEPMKPMEPMKMPDPWWPASYGQANAAGGQNDVRYAYFGDKRRLLVDAGDGVKAYDTGEHQITGIQQAQGDRSRLVFTSQRGPVATNALQEARVEP